MVGTAVFTGAEPAAVTTPVCGDVPVALPEPLVPVTTTRIVEPASAATGVYVEPFAPGMSTQLLPDASHRCH